MSWQTIAGVIAGLPAHGVHGVEPQFQQQLPAYTIAQGHPRTSNLSPEQDCETNINDSQNACIGHPGM